MVTKEQGAKNPQQRYGSQKQLLYVAKLNVRIAISYVDELLHSDDEVEFLYGDIAKTMDQTIQTQFTVTVLDFNVEWKHRNMTNLRLILTALQFNILKMKGLCMMNWLFKKMPQRKWIRQSPSKGRAGERGEGEGSVLCGRVTPGYLRYVTARSLMPAVREPAATGCKI
ncbi:hypothetical protein EVAR_46438_1 [Eumeta japonica]|uniref:Uncharacterized protein n=1 Tax=Eumeta variegata TaxID=151549 RepID=A0A4C1XH91_EUMVA|nr:hypothetical protein EVAR_46438_1 [Eumeta japonica]